MKTKCALSFLAAAMLGISLFADAVKPPEEMTLGELIRFSSSGGKTMDFRSVKLIYEVSGKKLSRTFLVIRAEYPDSVRFDIVTEKELYIACRSGQIYWGYDKNGVADLTPEDVRSMKCDLAFLPIPFLGTHAYAPLTKSGQGLHRDTPCDIYKTHPLERPNENVTCWIDAKTGLLRLIKTESMDGYYASYYRGYQEISGVKIASEIHISSATGTLKMKLYSVDWNAAFPADLFTKGIVIDGPLIQELQKEIALRNAETPTLEKPSVPQTAAKAPAPDAAKVAAAKAEKAEAKRLAKIEKLEKEIRHLDIEIQAKEKQLSDMEKLFAANREDAVTVAQDSVRYNYRNTWGYRSWYRSGSNHASNRARRAAKKLAKEAEAAAEEYDKLSKKLIDLRLQRSDAAAELEKLQKQDKL